jgi:hypothetical protein
MCTRLRGMRVSGFTVVQLSPCWQYMYGRRDGLRDSAGITEALIPSQQEAASSDHALCVCTHGMRQCCESGVRLEEGTYAYM